MNFCEYSEAEKNEIINDILCCIELGNNSSMDVDRLGEMCAFLISLKKHSGVQTDCLDNKLEGLPIGGYSICKDIVEDVARECSTFKRNKRLDEDGGGNQTYSYSYMEEAEIKMFFEGMKWAMDIFCNRSNHQET